MSEKDGYTREEMYDKSYGDYVYRENESESDKNHRRRLEREKDRDNTR